jgi:hypothetical protein
MDTKTIFRVIIHHMHSLTYFILHTYLHLNLHAGGPIHVNSVRLEPNQRYRFLPFCIVSLLLYHYFTMEATVEPTFICPGDAMIEAESAYSVVVLPHHKKWKRAKRSKQKVRTEFNMFRMFHIVSILLESFTLRCAYSFVLNYSGLPGPFSFMDIFLLTVLRSILDPLHCKMRFMSLAQQTFGW